MILKDKDCHIRCGVAIGDISAGVIDGKTFRIFGSAVHLASRLESICKKDEIVYSEEFYKKMENINCKKEIVNLKGFNEQNVYIMHI